MRRVRFAVFGLGLSLSCGAQDADAAETAFNIYPTGSLALGAGSTPPPGFYVTPIVGYYEASIGGNITVGRVAAVGVNVKLFNPAINLPYVPDAKVLGGLLGFSVNLPAGHIDLGAQAVIGPLSVSREVSGWGFGDVMARAQLGWSSGTFSHTVYVSAMLPTGRYEPTFAPNIGLNRPAADATWAFTYVDPTTKLEFSGSAGVTFNARNTATDYVTGVESHFEWAVGKHFGEQFALGIAGYHYRQLTDDSGSGATLGAFVGRNNGIGPALSYVTQIAGHLTVFSLRHYWEYEAARHFQGTLSLASVTVRY